MVWEAFEEVVKAREDVVLEKHATLKRLDRYNPLLNLVQVGSHGPVYNSDFTNLYENRTDSFFDAFGKCNDLLEGEIRVANRRDFSYCGFCLVHEPFLEGCGVYNRVNAAKRKVLKFKPENPCAWKIRKNQDLRELTREELVIRINNCRVNGAVSTREPLSIEDITSPLKIKNLSDTARRLPK